MAFSDKFEKLDFRERAVFSIGVAGLVVLTPFAVNNLINARLLLGFASVGIVVVLLANSVLTIRGRYSPLLALTFLVPLILLFLVISMRVQGIIGFLWAYPALLAFYIVLPERQAWVANVMLMLVVIPCAWLMLEFGLTLRVFATLVAVTFFSALYTRIIGNFQQKLEDLALTDSLTGLSNRVLLIDSLEQAVTRSDRTKEPNTLIAIDLDNFKTINDRFGHERGDNVLRGFSDFLRKRIRTSDKAFRMGGEEFLLLLYDADIESGLHLAEELRQGLENLQLLPGKTVTASFGVAMFETGETTAGWMERADRHMYKAKSLGRNCVIGDDIKAKLQERPQFEDNEDVS